MPTGVYERKPFTMERRQNIAKVATGRVMSPEAIRKSSGAQRGVPKKKCLDGCECGKHKPGSGQKKYVLLTEQWDHPLHTGGLLYEHRKVLYDKIGPGPHECHWNSVYGCNRVSLIWSGTRGICVDHLDGNKLNNDPENLVPSCSGCNVRRHRWGVKKLVDQ